MKLSRLKQKWEILDVRISRKHLGNMRLGDVIVLLSNVEDDLYQIIEDTNRHVLGVRTED